MEHLLKSPFKFLNWWLVEAPRTIFLTSRRIINLVNNQISFTTNLKLLFTPLFGDYTLIGRFIGFVVRIFEIIFGSIFLIVLMVVLFAAPFLWWAIPFVLIEHIGLHLIALGFGVTYLLWTYLTADIPDRRVSEVDETWCKEAARPKTLVYYNQLLNNSKSGMHVLIHNQKIAYLLKRVELRNSNFMDKLESAPEISKIALCEKAFEYAKKHDTRYIEPEHLFLAVLSTIPKYDIFLNSYGVKLETIEEAVKWQVSVREELSRLYIWQEDYEMLFTGGFGKGMLGRVTPYLDSLSEDLTRAAKSGKSAEVIGRGKTITEIADILNGSKENVLVVGPAGCGKTTLIKGIARSIIVGTQYKSLQNKRLVSLDIGRLIAGTKTAGGVTEKLNWVLDDVKGSGDIILFIDEIHNLVAGTDDASAEMSAIYTTLEPHLAEGKLQFIGATTTSNYRKYIEPNDAFARLFHMVEIEAATPENTLKILTLVAKELEKEYGVFITYSALERAVLLTEKLIQERVFPDKAVDILSRAVTKVASSTKEVNVEVIEQVISDVTHLPTQSISENEAQKVLGVENEMKKMVIGQDHALKQVSAALKRARAGIRNEEKPIASFLFVGTTGVGKTQTAKALAKSYFGDKKAMIRLDMSEYQQIDSINRLLGNPKETGGGILSNQIRSRPFSLVLLDEIEKAHPNILMAFLQVLDEGHLTDNNGIKLDFTNTIIIATSNVGTRTIQEIFQRNGSFDEMRDAATSDVRRHFAPEFLNRFTGIVIYNPLTMENVRKITLLVLEDVKKLAEEKSIRVTFEDKLVTELMQKGYSMEWGARPLQRLIEDTVESYIAEKILTKELKPGDEIHLGLEVFQNHTD